MLALDDFLGLLRDAVELDVFGALFEIGDLQLEALVLVHDLLEHRLVPQDVCHVRYFRVAFRLNKAVLQIDVALQDQDRILVISGHRCLCHFDLSLFQVDNHLEVVLELLDSIQSLGLLLGDNPQLILQLVNLLGIPLIERL